MKKRLLVFGGCGFVGGAVAKLSKKTFETALAGSHPKSGFEEYPFYPADIANLDEVKKAIDLFRPQVVVNAAAMSDIDKAENNKELAYRVNVVGAANVARASLERGCKSLFISSDAVFDGKGQAYSEQDTPAPVNYYGLTKFEAEKAVLSADPTSIVARVSLVLGFGVSGGNSFLARMKQSLQDGKPLECVRDEVRTPIDVRTLAESILELVEGGFEGVMHLGSTQSIDRYELALRVAALMGFDPALIKPKPTAEATAFKAARHKNGILDVSKARSILVTTMRGIDDSLNRAIESEGAFL